VVAKEAGLSPPPVTTTRRGVSVDLMRIALQQ
jgi:hypothetical protein